MPNRTILRALLLALLCAAGIGPLQAAGRYTVRGRVIDRLSRRPVPYAAVVVDGDPSRGASADSLGRFAIEGVEPGLRRLAVSSIGYTPQLTPEFLVAATTPFVEIELEPAAEELEAVEVRPSPFRRSIESPVSMHVIGVREIEKSPGSNRDISRIVRSYPGVAFSPVGYRNDLIVRGGGPAENRFYMDGIEIPNINHFATQGATGGPVSIVNSDLIREIDFYTGAFPASRSGALSSVLDLRLRDGDPERHAFKATLGASEVGISGSGPAYVYLFIDGLIRAGIRQGLSEDEAKTLAINTVSGGVDMVAHSEDKTIDELVNAVCSKGGTTIQAVESFRRDDLAGVIDRAVDACVKRAEELSR